jgi:hypothetical protein
MKIFGNNVQRVSFLCPPLRCKLTFTIFVITDGFRRTGVLRAKVSDEAAKREEF